MCLNEEGNILEKRLDDLITSFLIYWVMLESFRMINLLCLVSVWMKNYTIVIPIKPGQLIIKKIINQFHAIWFHNEFLNE